VSFVRKARTRRARVARLAAGLGLAVLTGATAQASEAVATENALQACARIDASTDRLTCYDQLAGRKASSSAVPRASAPGATAVASNSSAAAGGTAAAAATAPAPLAPPPKEAFGLYRAEHPVAPQGAPTLTAKVVSMAVGGNGRPTVALEGVGVWELDAPDAVLSSGDTVTIKRASLGSFLMTTPSGRTHRVQRIR
jgi:hypothetical protein